MSAFVEECKAKLETALVICTAHLTLKDLFLMDVGGVSHPRLLSGEYEYIFVMPGEIEEADKLQLLKDLRTDGMSDTFCEIMLAAIELGVTYLAFDEDGEEFDNLPTNH